MKEIKAYIKQHKLDDVLWALHRIEGLSGVSVVAARGCGRGWRHPDADPGDLVSERLAMKLEVFCRDGLMEEVVAAIEKAAHTGLKGDGKIYVVNVEQAVRISSGERGSAAV
jgi:nitrogen regulatory protein PII